MRSQLTVLISFQSSAVVLFIFRKADEQATTSGARRTPARELKRMLSSFEQVEVCKINVLADS